MWSFDDTSEFCSITPVEFQQRGRDNIMFFQ